MTILKHHDGLVQTNHYNERLLPFSFRKKAPSDRRMLYGIMKKTFTIVHPKKKYDRLIEAIRRDIRKYLKRERKKVRPDGVDFWDFDCKFGVTEEVACTVALSELSRCITDAAEKKLASFYIEILAKPGQKKST